MKILHSIRKRDHLHTAGDGSLVGFAGRKDIELESEAGFFFSENPSD
jgi:hypothetical protein